jgi:prepilin-type N-terminal cleavage/methylation domain-containing protein
MMKLIFKNKYSKNIHKSQKGFTLVETMIAIGLFTVIMVIGITAVISVGNVNRKTQALRKVIDNMSFVMEDMARSMRLGDYFVCDESELESLNQNDVYGDTGSGPGQKTADGNDCKSISFEPYWDFRPTEYENQIVYYISHDGDTGVGTIFKKENSASFSEPMVAITPSEINIDVDKSGFTVVGSERPPGDTRQPKITIVLVGTVTVNGYEASFNMQTTVSQRSLDINQI